MGGEGRGHHECTGMGGGIGPACFARENQGGILRCDLEGGRGRRCITWGRVLSIGLRTDLEYYT